MRTRYFIDAFIALLLLAACSSAPGTQRATAVQLGGGSLSVVPPPGLVPVHWDDSPGRVIAEFNLPEGPDGGQPAYPDIFVDKLDDHDSGKSLDDYMQRVASKHLYGEISGTPKKVEIDGVGGYRFVAEAQGIADFADGRAGTYFLSHYEIAFWHDDSIYRCVLETAPDIDPKYVSVYEEFCSTMHFQH